MRAHEFITEKSQYYYHGTSNEASAKSILNSGSLVPGDHSSKDPSNLTPIVDRTYITSDMGYALIYALGANMIGEPSTANVEGYGHIFKIHKSNIKNRMPDEDVVGELARDIVSGDDDHGFIDTETQELTHLINYAFDNIIDADEDEGYVSLYDRFIDQEYEFFAAVGKYVLSKGSKRLIASFRRISQHHSGEGEMIIDKAWKFKKSDGAFMKKDGSDIAIKPTIANNPIILYVLHFIYLDYQPANTMEYLSQSVFLYSNTKL